ncbi:MAG: hypothetical protein ABIP48_19880, partial [Planctomycetota bacterium]
MRSYSDVTPPGNRELWIVLALLLCVVGPMEPWLSQPVRGEPPAKVAPVAEPAGSFLIPAWAFNRGNAKTFTT